MSFEFTVEYKSTDVLIVGGGIAGLMASISARDSNTDVLVMEKGNAEYSGRGRAGNDHFWCYIPEVHGQNIDAFMKECLKGPKLSIMQSGTSKALIRRFLEESYEIVKLWDLWGIPMKRDGKWEFSGHSFPGDVFTHLKYKGKEQKKILFRKALEKGVLILNRVMATDLIPTGSGSLYVIGLHGRSERIYVTEAKAVIIATGTTDRLYPPPVPGWLGSTPNCLTLTGDGKAMALKAGCEIVSPELPKRHMGPKYFARFGQATWIGVLKDASGKPVGTYVQKPERAYGDMILEAKPDIPEIMVRSGRGPVYMDMEGISEEDLEYMLEYFPHEGMASLLNHILEEGLDLRKDKFEFATYHLIPEGKIWVDLNCMTKVPGLFAAGDEVMVGIGPAATLGFIAGTSAKQYVKDREFTGFKEIDDFVTRRIEFLKELTGRKEGASWYEANVALQQIMSDYAGLIRYQSLLEAGYENLKRLKEKILRNIMARDQWELMRVLEVLNLIDLGEIIFLGALERKESRGFHFRLDYPFLDPTLNEKGLFFCLRDGKLTWSWRDL